MMLTRHRHEPSRSSLGRATSTGSWRFRCSPDSGIGADYGLPPSILADVINAPEGGDTEGKTGTDFSGLWALATKLATAIGAFSSLPIVAFLGFNPDKKEYDKTALIIVYIVLPVAIKIVAALLLWFIRIEAERGSVRQELTAAPNHLRGDESPAAAT